LSTFTATLEINRVGVIPVFAGMRADGEVAPISAVRLTTIRRPLMSHSWLRQSMVGATEKRKFRILFWAAN